jgi:starvation-inducible DNA-binding protein
MSKSADGLNQVLANATVLYQKLRAYHWYVKGHKFFELHAKFEELYDEWAETIDAVAERILTIGGAPGYTLDGLLKNATIKEASDVSISGPDMAAEIAKDLQFMVDQMGEVIEVAETEGDRGTANMLDEPRDVTKKNIWMLQAFLA